MATRPGSYGRLAVDRVYDALDALAHAAAARGVDTATLALAWALSQPDVTAVVVGPRRPAHLGPALAALGVTLSADERDELASLFP